MLAAEMQESADEAVAAVTVIITAARPVRVVREKLEHQIEQLHRFFRFPLRAFGLIAFDPGKGDKPITGRSGLYRRSLTAK
jgi:hypothetical protein